MVAIGGQLFPRLNDQLPEDWNTMKAPWKFLAQLTSRRPSAKAQESSLGNDTDPKAHGGELEHTSALPPNSMVLASPPAREEDDSVDERSAAFGHSDKMIGDDVVSQALKPPIDAEEAQTPARHEADHSGAEANSLVPQSAASTKLESEPRIKRRDRGKRGHFNVATQRAVATKSRQSLPPSSSRDLFFDEVTSLDEEIKILRIQLAQKLRLQNIQLKKMLERFEFPELSVAPDKCKLAPSLLGAKAPPPFNCISSRTC